MQGDSFSSDTAIGLPQTGGKGSFTGKSTITDGKVEGDSVTFTITAKLGDQEIKLNYKGKIAGSEIKFTSEMADGGMTPIEWTAKKQ